MSYIEPLTIPTFLTAPLPSYISLQTALFYHGVIVQVPGFYFAVSLGRKNKIKTSFGVFSIHRIDPNFFFDFETHYNPFFQIATPEKALLDYFYLSRAAPALFGKLPEIDYTRLRAKKINDILSRISDPRMLTYLKLRLKNEVNLI